jgi:hypothetical protein
VATAGRESRTLIGMASQLTPRRTRAARAARAIRLAGQPPYRNALIVVAVAATMAAAFATSYSLALGHPTPHAIPIGVVGTDARAAALAGALEKGVGNQLAVRSFSSGAAAEDAIGEQQIYGALVVQQGTPQLLVASASGASVARVLEGAAQTVVSPSGVPELVVVDLYPLPASDPQGLVAFYVVLAASILGFLGSFQLVANAKGLSLRAWIGVVGLLAVLGGLLLALAVGPLVGALEGPFLELWAVLASEIAIAALFCSTMIVLLGRWAVLPTFTLFVILGNASSGGAVAPPLLPQLYALIGQYLPPGAAVDTVRSAVYFTDAQQWQPMLVMAIWLLCTLAALVAASRLRRRVPAP